MTHIQISSREELVKLLFEEDVKPMSLIDIVQLVGTIREEAIRNGGILEKFAPKRDMGEFIEIDSLGIVTNDYIA